VNFVNTPSTARDIGAIAELSGCDVSAG